MSTEVETSRIATFKVSSRDSSTSLAMTKVAEKIIVALDVPTKTRALDLVRQLRQDISFSKSPSHLTTAHAPTLCPPPPPRRPTFLPTLHRPPFPTPAPHPPHPPPTPPPHSRPSLS